MTGRLRAFGAFLYDFVVGDDWMVAVVVVGALALTYALSHARVSAWWVLPAMLAGVLPLTLWRAIRKG